ncbi:MAG: hypothetical protein Q7S00_06475, partial [bacterium]|nr:hypothetical protein [bacterium]
MAPPAGGTGRIQFQGTPEEIAAFLRFTDRDISRPTFNSCHQASLDPEKNSLDVYCDLPSKGKTEVKFYPDLSLKRLPDSDIFWKQFYGQLPSDFKCPEDKACLANLKPTERVQEMLQRLQPLGRPEAARDSYLILVEQLASPQWEATGAEQRIVSMVQLLYPVLWTRLGDGSLEFLHQPPPGQDLTTPLRELFESVAHPLNFYRDNYPDQWKKLSPDLEKARQTFTQLAAAFRVPLSQAYDATSGQALLSPEQVRLQEEVLAAFSLLQLLREKKSRLPEMVGLPQAEQVLDELEGLEQDHDFFLVSKKETVVTETG